MERLTIVSADGHMAARPDTYLPYIDPAFRDAVLELSGESDEMQVLWRTEHLAADDEFAGWNMDRRVRDLDNEGIAAEIVHPGVQGTVMPFFAIHNRRYAPELRWAGTRAYHRWLADCLSEAQGRSFGVAQPGPCVDLAGAVDEIHWASEHGFVAVTVPQATFDRALPPVSDPYYEPIWSAVEETGMALSVHAGWGGEQGKFHDYAAKMHLTSASLDESAMSGPARERMLELLEANAFAFDMSPRRVLWQLMVGGVLDRHPDLTLVFTEIHADWVPDTLAALDHRCRSVGAPMQLLPSEYWVRNCFVTPSSPRTHELRRRHEIGVEQMMFGTDYPHPEGTYPQTREWLAHTFRGVPVSEARAILAENAIRCYGLDRAAVAAVAARIGPTVEEVVGGREAPSELLDEFDRRSGFHRPREVVDQRVVVDLFDADVFSVEAR